MSPPQALGGSDDLVYVKRRSKVISGKVDSVRNQRDRHAGRLDRG